MVGELKRIRMTVAEIGRPECLSIEGRFGGQRSRGGGDTEGVRKAEGGMMGGNGPLDGSAVLYAPRRERQLMSGMDCVETSSGASYNWPLGTTLPWRRLCQ